MVEASRAYGIDHLDERAHGLRFDDPDAVAFLAASPALPLFLVRGDQGKPCRLKLL